MNFKTVSVAEFRKNLQESINVDLKESALLLARHSDVVAVILDPKVFNALIARIAELESERSTNEGVGTSSK